MNVCIKLLPDNSGRVCIHWLKRDDRGPIQTKGGVVMTGMGPLRFDGVKGYIACQPELKSVNPTRDGHGNLQLPMHSDEIRAVTCPECLATEEAKAQQLELSKLVPA